MLWLASEESVHSRALTRTTSCVHKIFVNLPKTAFGLNSMSMAESLELYDKFSLARGVDIVGLINWVVLSNWIRSVHIWIKETFLKLWSILPINLLTIKTTEPISPTHFTLLFVCLEQKPHCVHKGEPRPRNFTFNARVVRLINMACN